MSATSTLEALRNSGLAAELSPEQSALLAGQFSTRELADGEVLVPEGTRSSQLHLLVQGAVVLVRGLGSDQPTELFTLAAGDTIGELSFLDDHEHYASVVARGPTTLISIERAALEALLARDPWIVYRVMRAIVRRVHGIQQRLSVQANELTNYIYKTHGRY